MNILQINASAKSAGSDSTEIADAITARLRALHPAATVTVRSLAQAPVAAMDALAVQARFLAPEARSPEQARRFAADDAVVAQFLAADAIVLGTPMYNFNIPAQLQNWIDAIVRPGATFRYTPQGPIGLTSGKTVYLALTRGGLYRDTPADVPVAYLKQILGFIGVTDVRPIYAEGMSRGPEMVAAARAAAADQIGAIVV